MTKTMAQVTVDPSGVARILGATALLLVAASLSGHIAKFWLGHPHVWGFVPLFDVAREGNVPTFFSVLLLLLAALSLAIVAALVRKEGGRDVARWIILSAGFLLMAYDEAFFVHERLVPPLRIIASSGEIVVLHQTWTIVGMVLILVLGLSFRTFLKRLPGNTRRAVITAASLYLGGAVGVELVGGGYAAVHGNDGPGYSLIATVEEGLEMCGVILFVRALLGLVAERGQHVQIRFADRRSDAPGQAAPRLPDG